MDPRLRNDRGNLPIHQTEEPPFRTPQPSNSNSHGLRFAMAAFETIAVRYLTAAAHRSASEPFPEEAKLGQSWDMTMISQEELNLGKWSNWNHQLGMNYVNYVGWFLKSTIIGM